MNANPLAKIRCILLAVAVTCGLALLSGCALGSGEEAAAAADRHSAAADAGDVSPEPGDAAESGPTPVTDPDPGVEPSPTTETGIQPGAPWPMLGHDPGRTGRGSALGPQQPVILHSFASTPSLPLTSPTVAADGTIYIGTGCVACADGNGASLYAVHRHGSRLWVLDVDEAAVFTPAVGSDGRVFAATSSGKLYAINSDGTVGWSDGPAEYIDDGTGGAHPDAGGAGVGSRRHYLLRDFLVLDMALRARRGRAMGLGWPRNRDIPLGTRPRGRGFTMASPGTLPSVLPSVSIYGSTEILQVEFPRAASTGPARTQTILEVRHSPLSPPPEVTGGPTVSGNGLVHFGLTLNSNRGELYTVSLGGDPQWVLPIPPPVHSPAIGADGTVYFGASDGSLYAVSGDGALHAASVDGEPLWALDSGGDISASPIIDGAGTIYFVTATGMLHAANPDGTEKWKIQVGDAELSSPALGGDGLLYVSSSAGVLYAIGEQ